jgi:hypothetical protein
LTLVIQLTQTRSKRGSEKTIEARHKPTDLVPHPHYRLGQVDYSRFGSKTYGSAHSCAIGQELSVSARNCRFRSYAFVVIDVLSVAFSLNRRSVSAKSKARRVNIVAAQHSKIVIGCGSIRRDTCGSRCRAHVWDRWRQLGDSLSACFQGG